MRQIIYTSLKEAAWSIFQSFLEISCTYTPLVEAGENNTVFLDITGCGVTEEIIEHITGRFFAQHQIRTRIGLASSKLVAQTAASTQKLPWGKSESFRTINRPEAFVIQVLPGQEADFMADISLKDFSPFNLSMIKKLYRMGFSSLGEIAMLSPVKLQSILGTNSCLLLSNIQGIDTSPVIGSYPPSSLIYSLDLEPPCLDMIKINRILRDASRLLADRLASRHQVCQYVKLEIITETGLSSGEKVTSSYLHASEQLTNLLTYQLDKAAIKSPIINIKVTLEELSPLQIEQPDLFSYRTCCQGKPKEAKLKNTLQKLHLKFPGAINQGFKASHREQLLCLWDPWRFS